MRICIINPNSSHQITDGLIGSLGMHPDTDPESSFVFYTAPGPAAPPSIDDTTTSVLSAAACFPEVMQMIPNHDGFLVCCFSDHPLTHMLREQTSKPVIGIFEAAISHALLVGSRFGIITTGLGWRSRLTDGVRAFLGAGSSDRFVGVEATGLGVLELHNGEEKVVQRVHQAAKLLAEKGADVMILGCAGMTGMDNIVRDGARDGGATKLAVIDGAKAGVEILIGLVRRGYTQ